MSDAQKKLDKIVELIGIYGQIDENHHKTWVIDQVTRIALGSKYDEYIKEYTKPFYVKDSRGNYWDSYSWNEGVPP